MSINYQVAKTPLRTAFGEFDFYCFSWGLHEEDNILCQHKKPYSNSIPLVRIQSACYTAEIFRSTDCDCHAQLARSLRRIQVKGGLLIYMLCDGRGAGLLSKVHGLSLGHTRNLDTSDAYRHLGLEQDPRTYERAVEVLRYFEIRRLRLLTNNPRKISGLTDGGLTRLPRNQGYKNGAHSQRVQLRSPGRHLSLDTDHEPARSPCAW